MTAAMTDHTKLRAMLAKQQEQDPGAQPGPGDKFAVKPADR